MPNRIKNIVKQKGQRITYILTRPYMTFFRFFWSKKCVSVVTCKIRRAFSIEGSEVNWLPLSLKISVGKPPLENTSSKASATLFVSILGNATASGHYVVKSSIVKIYLLPLSDTGVMGPIRSTATWWNGTYIIGISPRENFCYLSFRYSLLTYLTWSSKPSYITGDAWPVKASYDQIYCRLGC